MNLGNCKFNGIQKGSIVLDADGKGVTITPSKRPNGERFTAWSKGVGEQGPNCLDQALEDTGGPVKLSLVSSLAGVELVKELAGKGQLKFGTWHEGGRWKPAKLDCYYKGLTVAQFSAGK